jgi:HSP20 family protein
MNLIPWRNKGERTNGGQPAEPGLSRLRGEIDDLFHRFFHDPFELGTASRGIRGPQLDLAESENEVVVKAEVPGVDPKDVDIHVAGNVLTIRGEKKEDREERGKDFHLVERQYGSFHRSIPLPTSVDPDRVAAEYKNGVLTVTLTKHPDAKPKRIPVRRA